MTNINILITINELLDQRGYVDKKLEEDRIIAKNKNLDIICVFTNVISKFNIDKVKECISILNNMNVRKAICLYNNTITPIAKKAILNIVDYDIELFNVNELYFNITKHRLVPQHVKLSEEESIEFKNMYGIKIPSILKTDPVSKFLGFQRGDIIKIIRKDDISYRIVK